MNELNIKNPIFESAYIDGQYSKAEVIETIDSFITPEKLNESDETVLGGVLFTINDSGIKNLTLLQLIKKIELNKTNASKALLAKIYSVAEIKSQIDLIKEENRKENRKLIIGSCILVSILALILAYKYNLIKMPISPATEGAKVVVLDTARLAYSATVPYMSKQLTPEQAQQVSLQYRDNLQKVVREYTDNGYIIINRSAVYVTSETNDITDQVIKSLGFEPVERERFDADYSNQEKYEVLKTFAQTNVSDYETAALNDANQAINAQAEQQLNNAEVITDSNGQSIDIE
ncbi:MULTISPECIES: hypothetical protein [Acinetobacter]|uniref:hypothetical protein n=1 Tax=Acinetobacter TaxID=469 RepID=UPI00028D81BF|nr:hypothetical protein [Acinetobacter radioresistens]BBL22317.1 hypothetical protein ACRAD_29880 [Acinetobacter radioresistens DSM 6976 = NBRC 102413 = CIP 103788]